MLHGGDEGYRDTLDATEVVFLRRWNITADVLSVNFQFCGFLERGGSKPVIESNLSPRLHLGLTLQTLLKKGDFVEREGGFEGLKRSTSCILFEGQEEAGFRPQKKNGCGENRVKLVESYSIKNMKEYFFSDLCFALIVLA